MAFTKELVKSCANVNEKCAWDMWLAWNAPFFGKCVAIDRELVKYRQHGNNDSKTVSKKTGADRFGRLQKLLKCLSNPISKWFFNVNYFGERFILLKESLPVKNEDLKAEYLFAMEFYKDILSLEALKKRERIKVLKKVRNNGAYAAYRGGRMRYYLDLLNVLLH